MHMDGTQFTDMKPCEHTSTRAHTDTSTDDIKWYFVYKVSVHVARQLNGMHFLIKTTWCNLDTFLVN
jgi:hypothetical protein